MLYIIIKQVKILFSTLPLYSIQENIIVYTLILAEKIFPLKEGERIDEFISMQDNQDNF